MRIKYFLPLAYGHGCPLSKSGIGNMCPLRRLGSGFRGQTAYLEHLNPAYIDHISVDAKTNTIPRDNDCIVDGDALGPQRTALVGWLLGVVFEGDGCHPNAPLRLMRAGPLMLPVRRCDGHAISCIASAWRCAVGRRSTTGFCRSIHRCTDEL